MKLNATLKETLKTTLPAILLCLATLTATAQGEVSNIRVQQHDTVLFVTYDLSAKADIDVYVSFDGGVFFTGPLHYVTGAVGKGIMPERNKIFAWNIVKEVGYIDNDNAVIKIIAYLAPPPAPVEWVATQPFQKLKTAETAKGYYIPHAVGLEWGVTPSKVDVGLRYTINILPYIGIDALKIKANYGWQREDDLDEWQWTNFWGDLQALAGVRLATPNFGTEKVASIYTSFRIGYGYGFRNFLIVGDEYWSSDYGGYIKDEHWTSEPLEGRVVTEWDIGVHFKRFFMGVSLSSTAGTNENFFGVRMGVDVGKVKPLQPEYREYTPEEEAAYQWYLKHPMGFDFGVGFENAGIGIRFTRNIYPWLGIDLLKVKYELGWFNRNVSTEDITAGSFQTLCGLRFTSPRFGKKKSASVYTAFRAGPGYYDYSYIVNSYDDGFGNYVNEWEGGEGYSLGIEWDVCVQFGYFFVGPSLSIMGDKTFAGLRFGVDIGKRQINWSKEK